MKLGPTWLSVVLTCSPFWGCGAGEPESEAERSQVEVDLAELGLAEYQVERRSLQVRGVQHEYLLARPSGQPIALPLVIAFHPSEQSAASVRSYLGMEPLAKGAAIFVYPEAPGGHSFPHMMSASRDQQAEFTRSLIAVLANDEKIARADRVFLLGVSSGATAANTIACRLGPSMLRGVGVLAGLLYPAADLYPTGDYTVLPNGAVSCPFPAGMIIWGMDDNSSGTSFDNGQRWRDQYRATLGCSAESIPVNPTPCVEYTSCTEPLRWCAIPDLRHDFWGATGEVLWSFVVSRL